MDDVPLYAESMHHRTSTDPEESDSEEDKGKPKPDLNAQEMQVDREQEDVDRLTFNLYRVSLMIFLFMDLVLIVAVSVHFSRMPVMKMLVSFVLTVRTGFYTDTVVSEGPPVSFASLLLGMLLINFISKTSALLNASVFSKGVVFSLTQRGLHVHSLMFHSLIFAITFRFVTNLSGLEYLENVFTGIIMVPAAMFLCCALLIKNVERGLGDMNLWLLALKLLCLMVGILGFLAPIIVSFASIGTIRIEDIDLSNITLWKAFPLVVLVFQITFLLPSLLNITLFNIPWTLFELCHQLHIAAYLIFLTFATIDGVEVNGVFDQTAALRSLVEHLV